MSYCGHKHVCELERRREGQSKTLWAVLGINAVMFFAEFLVGYLAGSVALQADSLDMLSDTLVYGFSLYAIGRSTRWRAGAAVFKGGLMALFGLGVFCQSLLKFFTDTLPMPRAMLVMSALALVANASCLLLLARYKADDLNMRSTWVCSRNDIIANASVFLAAGLVAVTHSKLPDVGVGIGISGLFLKSAVSILREARHELRHRCATGRCPVNRCLCEA